METNEKFLTLKNSEAFSMDKKVITICKTESFRRNV